MNRYQKLLLPGLLTIALSGLAACVHGRPSEVPASATLVAAGDKETSFTSPRSGTIYIYDAIDDRIVYSGHVLRGQSVEVDREHDKITLDGRTVFEKGLKKANTHRIYFLPDVSAL